MARATQLAPTKTAALPEFDIKSIFDDVHASLYYRYTVKLFVPVMAGGVPSDPKVAEGWLKTKLGLTDEALIQEAVAQTMAERGISAPEAVEEVSKLKHLNGFKRSESGLYVEGRQAKAMIKEAASVAVDTEAVRARGHGLNTKKGLLSFIAETCFVEEARIPLLSKATGRPVTEPAGINQRFVHTWRGSGIQYEEYVENVEVAFTVASLHEYTDAEWAAMWVIGQQIGFGASRSQGYGKYAVTQWKRLPGGPRRRRAAAGGGE